MKNVYIVYGRYFTGDRTGYYNDKVYRSWIVGVHLTDADAQRHLTDCNQGRRQKRPFVGSVSELFFWVDRLPVDEDTQTEAER